MSKYARYLWPFVHEDLKEKMVFVGGPRQVGKTTFSKTFLEKGHEAHAYFNWDLLEDRKKMRAHMFPLDQKLVVCDEIHKYARWRMLLKGYFDKYRKHMTFLVTGSARLDHYRKGGDSLMGRYHYYRLHPYTLPEAGAWASLNDLLSFGGFPEPLHKKNSRFHRRWQSERRYQVVHDDIRELERVRELSYIELLMDALPEKVGSPLSLASLRENLQVSHDSISLWIKILEQTYYAYRIPPFGSPKIRAVKKEQKLYLWDWSEVQNPGARFENLVAGHLLKYCHFLEDTEGYRMELRYIRDTDKREVDFVVLRDRKPMFAVECKTGEKNISPHLFYFKNRTSIPKFYQVHQGVRAYQPEEGIFVLPFEQFCQIEGLV